MKKIKLKITGVDCANCAAKIEEKVARLSFVQEVNYHFITEKMQLMYEEKDEQQIVNEVEKIVHLIEHDAKVEVLHHHHDGEHCECGHHHHHDGNCECGHHHHHEEHCECGHHHHDEKHCECGHHHHDEKHCECEHHHHDEEHCECGHHHHDEEHCECGHHHHDEEHCECGHHHEETKNHGNQKYQFMLEGLDCAHCAAKVEHYLNRQAELSDVQILFIHKTIKLNAALSSKELKEYLQKKIDEVESGVQVIEVQKQQSEQKDTEKARLAAAVGLLLLGFVFEGQAVSLVLFASCYLLAGYEVLIRAFRNCLKGQIFDENFLMAVATIGAIVVSEYAEACAVMVFYQIGEYFQKKAVEKSRKSIGELMDIRVETAHVEKAGQLVDVNVEDVKVNEVMVVRAGEKIPLDGVIIEGETSLDTRALTGESKVQYVSAGEAVLSGAINVEGLIRVCVSKPYHESTVARILELVENAGSRKAPAEAFITRFARVYTPFVCLMALLIAIVPPFVIEGAQWMDYMYRACTFLVISCPCALVISVPLSYFAGIGGLSSQGILIKGGSYLDALCQVDTYVFDKTGTLTKGNFELAEVLSEQPDRCLNLAAMMEAHSNHPIAKSISKHLGEHSGELEDLHELAGKGISCRLNGKVLLCGNDRLMQMHGIDYPEVDKTGTLIHVAEDQKYLGTLVIVDEIRAEAKELIKELKRLGKKVIMFSGDQKSVAEAVAKELNLDEVHAELLPDGKVIELEKLIQNGSRVAFVGDGMNDAPVLAVSHVGFAMGGIGSDAAIEAADVVLMRDDPSSVGKTLKNALKVRQIVKENIYGTLLVKFVILLLGAMGIAGMWAAVFADVGVALIAVLNAIRAMNKVE